MLSRRTVKDVAVALNRGGACTAEGRMGKLDTAEDLNMANCLRVLGEQHWGCRRHLS